MNYEQARLLRIAFLAGAVTDAGPLPMLVPPLARFLWGFENTRGRTASRWATARR